MLASRMNERDGSHCVGRIGANAGSAACRFCSDGMGFMSDYWTEDYRMFQTHFDVLVALHI